MPIIPRILLCLYLPCCFNVVSVLCQSSELTTSPEYREIGLLMSRRDHAEAVNAIKRLIDVAPEFEHAYEKLAAAAAPIGQLDQSRSWLVSLLNRATPNNSAYFGLALIDYRKRDYAKAIENYRQYLTHFPESELGVVNLIRTYRDAGRLGEAESFLNSKLAAQPNNAALHLGMGYYFINLRKIDDAIKELDAALFLNPRTTDAPFYKLYAWWSERRYGKALELIEQHRSAFESDPDKERMKANFNFIGAVYRAAGRYPEAIASLEKTRALAQEFGDLSTEQSCLSQIGGVWLRQSYYSQALSSYQRGLEIAREVKAAGDAGRILGNIGDVYFLLGDFATAMARYNEGLELAQQAQDTINRASILMSIGNLSIAENKPELAINNYEQALTIGAQMNNPATRANALEALGFLYIQTANFEKAASALQQALNLALEMATPDQQAAILNHIGELHLRRNEPQLAIESFSQARQIAEPINNLQNVWKALAGLAAASTKLGALEEAHNQYRQAIDLMESVRARLTGADEKTGFFQDKIAVYKKQVALLLGMDRKSLKPQYTAEAFSYTERARARALLDLLAEAKVDIEQSAAPDLLKQSQELQQRIAQLNTEMLKLRSQEISKQDKTAIGKLEKSLDQADADLGDWLRELRKRDPRYAALKYPEPITLSAAQQMLDEQTLLLSYSLGETESFVFAVTHNSLEVKRLPSEATLTETVRKFLAAITEKNNPSPEEYRRHATRLSQYLLQPLGSLLAGKRSLVIVPDGALQRLPFEALLLPGQTITGDLRRSPYLIRRFAISYVPSVSVWAELQKEPAEKAVKSFIAFGDPAYEAPAATAVASTLRGANAERINLQRLPFSRSEIDGIARLFADNDRDLFLGEAAREDNVKASQRLSHYRFVHFSTHGYINEARPRFSGLLLSPPRPTASFDATLPAEDGLLSAYEIFNLKLKADLVVLSACETGLGKEMKGEGLITLTRAFMFAGTPSLIVSLWNVNDESAADLMVRFYRNLKTGRMSKSEALRQAQLETINDNGFPFYWAPFVLVGKS
jgi:CHAT domain-containing protein/tetratricopeptide (TPR) repeat protein